MSVLHTLQLDLLMLSTVGCSCNATSCWSGCECLRFSILLFSLILEQRFSSQIENVPQLNSGNKNAAACTLIEVAEKYTLTMLILGGVQRRSIKGNLGKRAVYWKVSSAAQDSIRIEITSKSWRADAAQFW